ncbi:MAG TPA: hypothetical protein PK890_12325, partial [Terrimesophilobacter sp.]|nr:hypothetical protein [Terrimesophilobacter sp.]
MPLTVDGRPVRDAGGPMTRSGGLDWAPVAHAWREAGSAPEAIPVAEARMAQLASTAAGAEFLRTLADEILRYDTDAAVAKSVARLSAAIEGGGRNLRVPWRDRIALALGAGVAPLMPRVAAWFGRRVALRHLGHALVWESALERALAECAVAGGIRPVIAPVLARAIG